MRLPSELQLRRALGRWFRLAVYEADGRPVAPADVEAVYQELIRLRDDVGEAREYEVVSEEADRFLGATGRCGWCGGHGAHGVEGA